MDSLRILFSHLCGQQHLWTLDGVTLPFCQRCTGLYVGAFCALVLVAAFRPRPNAFQYWLHGVFMLVMFPFGFHLVEHGGIIRTFTGALFAFGLVYYLALNPISLTSGWKGHSLWRSAAYFTLVIGAIVLLLTSVQRGGAGIAFLFTILGTLGLGVLVLLVAANLIMLPRIFRTLLHRPTASGT